MMILASSLGWTLLHSTWQGALLGLLAWVSLALARNRSPRLRHDLSLGFLLAMVLAFLLTWILLASAGAAPIFQVRLEPLSSAPEARTVLPLFGALPGHQPWPDGLARVAGSLWLLGVPFMFLRQGVGLYQSRQLFRHDRETPPGAWLQVVETLRERMGVRRPVRLFLSHWASSPMVWGLLRPVILLPAGALLNLDPRALEAVLAHEMAHLRRLDHLGQALQALAETLLFYHPAVWWLSRQVRILREHCCDDEAVAWLGDPLPYAEALARLEVLRRTHPLGPALPVGVHASQRGPLMNRIERMLRHVPGTPPAFRGIALALGLAILGGGALFCQALQTRKTEEVPPAPSPAQATLRMGKGCLEVLGFPEALENQGKRGRTNPGQLYRLAQLAKEAVELRLQALEKGPQPPLPEVSKEFGERSAKAFERLKANGTNYSMGLLQLAYGDSRERTLGLSVMVTPETPATSPETQEKSLLESCRKVLAKMESKGVASRRFQSTAPEKRK